MRIGRRALATSAIAACLARPSLAQQAASKLRVGILRLASSGGVFIALDRGYFRDAGLDIDLVYFDAAQPIAVAAASGDIDIGVTAFTTGLFNLAGKGALSVVAGQSREVKGFPLIAYLASTHAPGAASIHLPKDLAGHRVGITQTGSTFHYSLALLAGKYGFPLSSVQLVALQSLTNVAAAVKGGAVDGALLPVTTARPLIDAGDARLLGWVGDETPWQLGAVFVSRRMKQQPKMIAQFLTAYRHGCRDYHDILLSAASNGVVPVTDKTRPLLEIIAKAVGQGIDQVRVGLPYVDPDARLDITDVANQIAWNQQMGFVEKGFGVDQVIDPSFVTP